VSLSASERLARARDAAAQVCDPEIPSLSLEDLGILRGVQIEAERVVVTLAPTYTACPATEAICDDVGAALEAAGVAPFAVRVSLAPAWSSDWITAAGRRKLLEAGIAPPACLASSAGAPAPVRFIRRESEREPERARAATWLPRADPAPPCPRCQSPQTELLSEYGSTACKSLYRCLACAEPFDYFKPY
jgi:ring-1,2-phenylacetyl-CoA epoxidase subunit PaaD